MIKINLGLIPMDLFTLKAEKNLLTKVSLVGEIINSVLLGSLEFT